MCVCVGVLVCIEGAIGTQLVFQIYKFIPSPVL